MITDTTVYIGVAINAIFTGIGVTIGVTLAELWIKPRLKKMHGRIRKHIKKLREI